MLATVALALPLSRVCCQNDPASKVGYASDGRGPGLQIVDDYDGWFVSEVDKAKTVGSGTVLALALHTGQSEGRVRKNLAELDPGCKT